MSRLSISDVAHQSRLKPSAIRYYEKLRLLPAPERVSGQRRYDKTVLYHLAVIQQARQAGFRLNEIQSLFFGFQQGTRAEARWRRLADRKLGELDTLASQIKRMRLLLKTNMGIRCACCIYFQMVPGIQAAKRSPRSTNASFLTIGNRARPRPFESSWPTAVPRFAIFRTIGLGDATLTT